MFVWNVVYFVLLSRQLVRGESLVLYHIFLFLLHYII